eukprot:CAMPEP_0117606498 /NCGR_PEP_ID=MMETSP0784-20121206/79743_1 /TAXON_ID=39447 /ORGANISM="" /LENGTH=513 /DNA_ID=CAMNT_0005409581 /DNA_START=76 /DNA_END=1618 /DNA_ORIENTATION=+
MTLWGGRLRLVQHLLLCGFALLDEGLADAAERSLDVSSLNPLVIGAEYAVRGAVPDRAMELEAMIKENPTGHGLPFNKTIQCNIGNPQALGQKPLTFNRQVLSMISNPELLRLAEASSDGTLGGVFMKDAVRRARMYITKDPAGVGAYTNSMGFRVVREEVAEFIARRDGHPSSADDIFITDGASAGVKLLYQAMLRPGGKDGVLVPIPQYPLYSALTALFDGYLAGYYLDEADGWGLTVQELRRALGVARSADGINPGNPTGQCLDVLEMKRIIEFCMREKLVLLADEVYQENVYAVGKQFNSFKKVAVDMDASTLELVSFHSASKGFIGECGIRGGYLELHNIDAGVKAQVYKLASITLCSNTHGQISVGLMVNPPAAGDESYETYVSERDAILSSLKRRAQKVAAALNALQGITCNPSEGAMYLFPQIHLPKSAVHAAAAASVAPDTFYCLQLLEMTGIATVPGSGFKQKDGTYHFRTTFLPPESEIEEVVGRMSTFHGHFMAMYADTEL